MRKLARRSLLLALCALTVAAQAGDVGNAAVAGSHLLIRHDGGELALALTGPSENFFGFQGVPEDDHQRQLVISGAALLRDAGTMFRLSPAAGCRILAVELTGVILQAADQAGSYIPGQALERLRERDVPLGGRPAPEPTMLTPGVTSGDDLESDRGTIHADYQYRCARPDSLDQIAVQVFMSFPAIGTMTVKIDRAVEPRSIDLSASAPLIELRGYHD